MADKRVQWPVLRRISAPGLSSALGELCPCGNGKKVDPHQLVCCGDCWKRIGGVLRMLDAAGILVAVTEAAGGPLSLAFGLSRKRGRAAMLARGRVIRAAWDRLRPMGRSHAEVRLLLGVDEQTFLRALNC